MKNAKPKDGMAANLATQKRHKKVPVKPSASDVAKICSLITAGIGSAGFSIKKLASELAVLRSREAEVDGDWDGVGELSASQMNRIKELWQAGTIEEARAAGRAAVMAETRRDLEQCGIAMPDEFYDALRKRANASRAAELRPGTRRGSVKYWEGLIEIVQNDNGSHSAVLLGEVQKAYTKIVEPEHSELSVAHSLLLASTKVMGKEGPLAQLFNAVRFAPDDKREEVALKAKEALCLVVDSLARKLPHTLHKSRKRLTLPGRGQVPLALVAIEEFRTWVLKHRDLPNKGKLQLLMIEKHPSLSKLSAAAWTDIWDAAGLAKLSRAGTWKLAKAKSKASAKAGVGNVTRHRRTTQKPK